MAIPPLTPGIRMIWTSRPTRWPRVSLHWRSLLRQYGSTSTMRTSFFPRPADSVQRKRPLRVTAPPPGWLPSVVSLPGGISRRPLGWSFDFGPTLFVGTVAATAAPAAAAVTTASGTTFRNLTWGILAGQPLPGDGYCERIIRSQPRSGSMRRVASSTRAPAVTM